MYLTDLRQYLHRASIGQFICFFFLVLTGYECWRFFVIVFEAPPTIETSKSVTTRPHAQSPKNMNLPLFGLYVPPDLSDGSLPQSLLDFEVVGVMFSVPEEESQVILKSVGEGERIYRVGDKISGGAVIEKITHTGVLIMHNGRLERLMLPKEVLQMETPSQPLKEEPY